MRVKIGHGGIREEIREMLEVRCERHNIDFPFSENALRVILEHSQGIPRQCLRLCEISYAKSKDLDVPVVEPEIVQAIVKGLTLRHE